MHIKKPNASTKKKIIIKIIYAFHDQTYKTIIGVKAKFSPKLKVNNIQNNAQTIININNRVKQYATMRNYVNSWSHTHMISNMGIREPRCDVEERMVIYINFRPEFGIA